MSFLACVTVNSWSKNAGVRGTFIISKFSFAFQSLVVLFIHAMHFTKSFSGSFIVYF